MRRGTWIGAAAVVAVIGLSGTAQAQQYSWNGVYIGVEGGTASGRGDQIYLGNNGNPDPNGNANPTNKFVANANPGNPNSFDLSGGLGGGHVGYMHQMGSLVLGVDGAWDWSNINGSSVYRPNTTPVGKYDFDINSLGNINARLGVANGRWLAYATGGLAFANLKSSNSGQCTNNNVPIAGCSYLNTGSVTQTGWDAGAGIAFAATESIIIGAEYLHSDLGSVDATLNDTSAGSPYYEKLRVRAAVDEIKARISWKFDMDRPAPAPLK